MHHVATVLALGLPQAGAIHRRQLRAAGIGWDPERRLLRSGVLRPGVPGVFFLNGAPDSWERQCWVGVLTGRSGTLVSHVGAARVHQIGRFTESRADVVEVRNLSRVVQTAAAHRSSSVPPHHRTEVRGLPVTTVERTVFDLASLVSPKRYRRGLPSLRIGQVARALDDAIGEGVDVQRFQALLDEHGGRGRGGTVVLRSLLEERGEGLAVTESVLEDLLVQVLDRYGLPQPARQRNLGGREERIGRVDFVYVGHNLVIEADGRRNHTALLDRESDAWRDLELAAAGFTVVRVTWRQLKYEPQRFARSVRTLLGPTGVRLAG